MAGEQKIHGAVSVGNRTYVAGQERELAEAIKAGEKDEKTRVDVETLQGRGVIAGFGGKQVSASSLTVNRQRTEKGKLVDPKSDEQAEEVLELTGTIAPGGVERAEETMEAAHDAGAEAPAPTRRGSASGAKSRR